ncbi:hypothetical protein PB1_12909 [Bacillus methanolicus PB1]|uniref:Uncharacterized protein n=1 Tax=Bacillus methanolicus PB1 TaxID=997296 RepID=I3DW37_BACMT|nr:hypothetical protein [Bacillus methanolicus]EIJ78458.1 hypothetical protein PB1_12909 [Bacillus methanolicus PB1]
MKWKMFLKIALAFSIIFNIIVPIAYNAEAATSYSATVNASKLNVRDKPSTND